MEKSPGITIHHESSSDVQKILFIDLVWKPTLHVTVLAPPERGLGSSQAKIFRNETESRIPTSCQKSMLTVPQGELRKGRVCSQSKPNSGIL